MWAYRVLRMYDSCKLWIYTSKKKKEVNEQIENIPYNRQANIFPLDLSNFYTAIHLI